VTQDKGPNWDSFFTRAPRHPEQPEIREDYGERKRVNAITMSIMD
jgi:hypothetical protein